MSRRVKGCVVDAEACGCVRGDDELGSAASASAGRRWPRPAPALGQGTCTDILSVASWNTRRDTCSSGSVTGGEEGEGSSTATATRGLKGRAQLHGSGGAAERWAYRRIRMTLTDGLHIKIEGRV
jgi:hypothetical protein